MYPEPTGVERARSVVALTDAAVPLVDAMKDPEIQKIAWERQWVQGGCRWQELSPQGIAGVPQSIDQVVPMPRYSVMRSINERLQ